MRTNDAINAARVTVSVKSLDSDSTKGWGTETRIFKAPFKNPELWDGGKGGHWRLQFNICK